MKARIKKVFRNKELFWTFIYQFVSLSGKLILIKLLAVSLTTRDYGYYALVISISTFIIMFPFSALLHGISRYVSIYQKRSKYKNFFTTSVLIFIILMLFYSLISLLIKLYLPQDSIWNKIYFLIIFFVYSEIVKIFFLTLNNINRERKNIAVSVIVEFGLKLSIIYLSHLSNRIDIASTLYIFIFSNLFASFLLIHKSYDKFDIYNIKFKESKIFFIRIWNFSLPLIIWAIFGWLRDMSSRWYLDYFLDKEHVAYFAMISSVAMIIPVALQGIIGSFFVPIIYQKENEIRGYTKKFLSYLLPVVTIIFFIGFLIIFIFKNEIILTIADKKYLQLAWMLPWMFLTYSLYVLSMIATYELFAHKKTKKLIWSSILPGVVSFISGYFFIQYYGSDGALYHYIFTYLSYSILTFYVVYKYWIKNNDTIKKFESL